MLQRTSVNMSAIAFVRGPHLHACGPVVAKEPLLFVQVLIGLWSRKNNRSRNTWPGIVGRCLNGTLPDPRLNRVRIAALMPCTEFRVRGRIVLQPLECVEPDIALTDHKLSQQFNAVVYWCSGVSRFTATMRRTNLVKVGIRRILSYLDAGVPHAVDP
jgi:hypothetical protein